MKRMIKQRLPLPVAVLLTRSMFLIRSACLAVFTALFLVLVSCYGVLTPAWADDPSDDPDDNQVYVNQLPDSSFLYETSIADLAQADSFYEGQVVLVQGEVVGDRINDASQDDLCWITLQDTDADNPSVVSVVMTKDQTSIIDTYGAYGKTGTTLQVRGIFHLQCSVHQGMSDIHVDEVSAVAPGATVESPVDKRFVVLAVISVLAGLGLMGIYRIQRERLR